MIWPGVLFWHLSPIFSVKPLWLKEAHHPALLTLWTDKKICTVKTSELFYANVPGICSSGWKWPLKYSASRPQTTFPLPFLLRLLAPLLLFGPQKTHLLLEQHSLFTIWISWGQLSMRSTTKMTRFGQNKTKSSTITCPQKLIDSTRSENTDTMFCSPQHCSV